MKGNPKVIAELNKALREELTAICWNFFLHIDRNDPLPTQDQTKDQFDAALDDAVGFAIECAVIGLAP